ncbi:peroxiredoxin family protein [Salinibaculum salinum]|uniref:peroxiredoxin family protein n=1 Tax=Salinibaculum salinum TaxID=3131996 RepID=UPI0030EC1BE7
MSESRPTIDFSLPNVGPGPDPCSLADLATEYDFVVVYLQRDHLCTNCRKQVQTIKDRYDKFRDRDTEVVSIVPEPREKVQSWQGSYDLPYPLLADPDVTAGETFDQPVRFGFLGSLSDFLGRMPEVTILDCRDGGPQVAWNYSGSSTFDRPDIDEVLVELDELRTEP